MTEAYYYSKEEDKIRCLLCPHNCLIAENKAGICKVRHNSDGQLHSNVYEEIAAIHYDPIEKKPLYHFFPGKNILSIGTIGCNLHCFFCQNFQLSQCKPSDYHETIILDPQDIVEKAMAIPGNLGIAYTYNEPTVFFELMMDTAKLAQQTGLKNVAISNGYINKEPLQELIGVTDAFNIDLKAFDEPFYQKFTGGKLEPVLQSLRMIYQAGRHLEITFLAIPTLNDSIDSFRKMIDWIVNELGPDVPLHISRYFPAWKSELPPTSAQSINELADIASKILRYVYVGNMNQNKYSSTHCPNCGNTLIDRSGYNIRICGITIDSLCKACGKAIGLPYVMPPV